MSIRTAVHESLPYIDTEPTPEQRAAAEALIAAELSTIDTSDEPSGLPALREPSLSPLAAQEQERVAAKQPLAAIDLSRYEDLDEPAAGAPAEEWQRALAWAYTMSTYLEGRHAHLALLERFGKNAWLVGNWQAEAQLAGLERELADVKRQIELVNHARRRAQEAVGGELQGLEDTWKRGVGRVLETEIAVEGLRKDVLERRRAVGDGGD
ncbi:hypothetical protein JX265_004343 [Neoarthrinium moseri]|uniref:Pre-mRNA-splicing factor SPF27 n=1 Tax=Neoarthrinium moseri TaxID=1658444 RepID=A0A9P9WQQ3_9PEZI|nr:uncharacterized protein JN550_001863 [Neoarthrinium moseri]KAI1850633.1 hypothetical protein JX266_003915 [Neoarthrinium moseri]KAI1875285.1 hypothetical protein JX265_004343 [Neoarthrinium moseri]KAI1875577.1 hypothetical protein JN550_001863 [Neoarthrinium moseri]